MCGHAHKSRFHSNHKQSNNMKYNNYFNIAKFQEYKDDITFVGTKDVGFMHATIPTPPQNTAPWAVTPPDNPTQ